MNLDESIDNILKMMVKTMPKSRAVEIIPILSAPEDFFSANTNLKQSEDFVLLYQGGSVLPRNYSVS
jgi:hypothetical protein